jgi:hypothetical protein
MKLPNAEAAVIDIRKIRDYCLSREHPRGKHKAQVFEIALGMDASHCGELEEVLRIVSQREEASPGTSDQYGARYIIDFRLERSGRSAKIRSCWIVRQGETAPRFVTCYVL